MHELLLLLYETINHCPKEHSNILHKQPLAYQRHRLPCW